MIIICSVHQIMRSKTGKDNTITYEENHLSGCLVLKARGARKSHASTCSLQRMNLIGHFTFKLWTWTGVHDFTCQNNRGAWLSRWVRVKKNITFFSSLDFDS